MQKTVNLKLVAEYTPEPDPPEANAEFSLEFSSYTVTEGLTQNVKILRTIRTDQVLDVDWAAINVSVLPVSGTQRFQVGETEKTIQVTAQQVDSDESGTFEISNPQYVSGPVSTPILGSPSTAFFFINDTEGPLPIADVVVRQDGAGDYTSIQTAINNYTPGDIIELQANSPGGEVTFTEAVTINNIQGTALDKCIIRVRDGDKVRLTANTVGGSILEITNNSAHWEVGGFWSVGENDWVREVNTNQPYSYKYSITVDDGANHIRLRDMGRRDHADDGAIWGANNYYAIRIGPFNAGSDDGTTHIWLDNCHGFWHGDVDSTLEAEEDWGNLLTMNAKNWLITDSTMLRGGHNAVEIQNVPGAMRRCVMENDWSDLSLNSPGYRAMSCAQDKYDGTKQSAGHVLMEDCVIRRGRNNPTSNTYHMKAQSYRGVFRNILVHKCDAPQGIGINASGGGATDGYVSESKFYNWTLDTVETLQDTSDGGSDLYEDSHYEYTFANFIVANLGAGWNTTDRFIRKVDDSAYTPYSNGLKGSEWRGFSIDIPTGDFDVYIDDDGPLNNVSKTITQALADWPNNFQDWDYETVTYANATDMDESYTAETALAGAVASGASAAQILTTMVGASGGTQTSGVMADARFFVLADSDFDLGYFGEEDDYVWIENTRVQLTSINKDTGAVQFTPGASWSDGANVYWDHNGSKVDQRGVHQ